MWARECACLCVCACVLLLAAAAEMSPMPFLMATRYGRSSPPARHLAPRNDRFFMSTRYGKRSDVTAGAAGVAGLAGVASDAGGGARALLCEFTGVFPLYRCRHKPPRYHKRSEEEVGEREEP